MQPSCALLYLHQHNFVPNYKNTTLVLCFSNALKAGEARSNLLLVTPDVYHPPLEVTISVSKALKRVRFGETSKFCKYAVGDLDSSISFQRADANCQVFLLTYLIQQVLDRYIS